MIALSDMPSRLRPARHSTWSWPWIIGVIIYAALVLKGANLLGDPGTYWHIAVGHFIIVHHAIPFHDPFSYTRAGTLWSSHEWLSELVLAIAYDGAGWQGVILLTALCGALGFALMMRALLRSLEPFYAILAMFTAIPMVIPHLLARPHSLVVPLMVLWVAGLARARDENRAPSMWLLPVMLLWSNLHGGYLFGLGLAVLFAGEALLMAPTGTRRSAVLQWGSFGLLSLIASMLTADGPFGGFFFAMNTAGSGVSMKWVSEWGSLNFQEFQWMEIWLFGLLLGALTLGIRLPWTRVGMVLALVHLGLAHVRFVELSGLLGPLVIAGPLGAELRRLNPGRRARFWPQLGVLTSPLTKARMGTLTLAVLAITFVGVERSVDRTDDFRTPASALAAVAKLHPHGNVMNADSFGGYLIFRGIKAFIDDRIAMYGDEFTQAYIDATQLNDQALPGLLRRYDVGWTLFPPGSHVVGVLDRLAGWKRFYTDGTAVVHVRTTEPDAGKLQGELDSPAGR